VGVLAYQFGKVFRWLFSPVSHFWWGFWIFPERKVFPSRFTGLNAFQA